MIAGGIVVSLAAAVANAFAMVLQAAEDRQAPFQQGGRLSLLIGLAHRRRWVAGTALMVLAWPLQVFALTLAPITIVQPLLSTTQLVLLAVARIRLREHVGRLEAVGALAIVSGVAAVVWAAPRQSVHHVAAGRLAAPMLLVGGLALSAFLVGRLRPQITLALVIGAGLSYAWVDFVNKLLAGALSGGHIWFAILWLAAILVFGALAFLQETTALQRRPAVTVAPVVGAVHDPLPVLMALWSGVAVWGSAPHRIAALVVGLAVIAAGAAILGRSKAVAQIAGTTDPVQAQAMAGCRGCSPTPSWVHRARGRSGALSPARNGQPDGRRETALAEDG